jgi:glycosyltransferase involved in cell wall biosynthesis
MSASHLPSVSVVLPAFNEALNLPEVVRGAVEILKRDYAEAWEIVLVDDGSSDDTQEVWRKIVETHRTGHMRLVRHEVNRGYGAALRSGFAAAGCETVFFTDADGQFRFDDLAKFSRALANCDMVIGWRNGRRDSFHRKFNAGVGNWLARTLLGVQARDINCAYKLFRRELLQKIPLQSDGLLINTELLALAARARWDCVELPVAHFPRHVGTPTGARPSVLLRIVPEYFRLRRQLASIDPARWTPPTF